MSLVRRGIAVALLLAAGSVASGCSGDDAWLSARLADGRLVLTIGGQCSPDSYLGRVQITGPGRQPLWEIADDAPERSTPTVTVGDVPAGFAEQVPLRELTWPVGVDVWTNFRYTVDIPLDSLAGGATVELSPQPVMNELSPVRPETC
ncbi:hypothetical protein AB0J80_22540 [Actinoplanes sp. NPDC049548]|uniref:hypothetical protein n=1 Tax=Actinoplanes sp. NPDC049548 TaxID=3155152 RepID=UPI00342FD204